MKVHLPDIKDVDKSRSYQVRIEREEGDKPIDGGHTFFYKVKNQLIGNPPYAPRNPEWVKISRVPGLNSIPYALRCNKGVFKGAYLIHPNYMISDVSKDYRGNGFVYLSLEWGS